MIVIMHGGRWVQRKPFQIRDTACQPIIVLDVFCRLFRLVAAYRIGIAVTIAGVEGTKARDTLRREVIYAM
jgi:hypothetical protein